MRLLNKDYETSGFFSGISTILAIIFIAFLLGLYGITYLIDGILPTPLQISDEKNHPDSFITERAQRDLKILTDMGPRVTGSSANDEVAVEFLKREITRIRSEAHPNHRIELDVQTVSGSYDLDRMINAYGNVQNVIVKLYSKDNSPHSVLINSHFDTVPESSGGGDDGINCAVMLEVLRKLTKSPQTFKHNIIFLFNGAEETPVQGSHGFITKHKWAQEADVVINLEGAGSGGKMMLFQVGPNQPWLLKYSQKLPHLNAQVLAEEMFLANLIPSDTDFRIFKSFGNTVGFDFAFIKNGYRYHTRFDDFISIPAGSYQYAGDNTLALARSLADAPELENLESQTAEETIYYDILGLFMLAYSKTVAIAIHSIASIFSIAFVVKSYFDFKLQSPVLYTSLTLTAILSGWIASGVATVIIASIINGLNYSLSWYNNPWIIFGLYVTPTIICSCGTLLLFNYLTFKLENELNCYNHAQIQTHMLRLIWTLLLIIGTIMGFRFIYIIFLFILFQTLSFGIIHIFRLQSSKIWPAIYIGINIIPNFFFMSVALWVITFFIPICGRIGSEGNPEFNIGIITLLLSIFILSVYTPLITLVRNPSVVIGILSIIFMVVFVIIFTPFGFPYSGDPEYPAPQRYWIYHASRTFRNSTNQIYKQDAGYYIYNKDRNSPRIVEKYVKELSRRSSVAEDCNNSLLCGLPLGRNRDANPHEITWIPAEQPVLDESISLRLVSKEMISDTLTRFTLTASGPDRMEIFISPKKNVKLVSSSTLIETPRQMLTWNVRPLYVVLFGWGKQKTDFTFTIDFEVPHGWNDLTFDIALVGRYTHHNYQNTPQYQEFLNQFPLWTDVIDWQATYESWVY